MSNIYFWILSYFGRLLLANRVHSRVRVLKIHTIPIPTINGVGSGRIFRVRVQLSSLMLWNEQTFGRARDLHSKKIVKVPKVLHDKLTGECVNKGKKRWLEELPVRMMSSTYNRRTSIWLAVHRININGSHWLQIKSCVSRKLLKLWNQARGACFNP